MRYILSLLLVLVFTSITSGDHLAWEAVPCATGYKVYFNEYSVILGDVATCDIDTLNLVPGTEYTFSVTAFNAYGESEQSNSVIYTKDAYTPIEQLPPMVICFPGPVILKVENASN
ncbi:fibronectin type III domain-containing protein [Pseudoalteromonas sp.]|uniref:fibronectin type III domain-containing protein n=1 Tax=Pseudoalteromonas sp. TaxID=53249 RepID=UPI00261444AF|nr:fibronectin type III domain-containing protein [Pseudoalteromonas sp.]MCP4585313.1 fibronectin type III domain-containing protein [Pseudoalteromonas sp.]